MRCKTAFELTVAGPAWRALRLLAFTLSICAASAGTGNWLTTAHPAPGGVAHLLLLSDGTVMAQKVSGGPTASTNIWYRLSPDIHGSYVNGTWTSLQPMNDAREYYASVVLQDGRVFIAGGEYGAGTARAEIYDPVANSWTQVNPPSSILDPTQVAPGWQGSPLQAFVDAGSILLLDGRVLIAPVFAKTFSQTLIYDPVINVWSATVTFPRNQNEATWVKLPDHSILTIDPIGNSAALNSSERYIPSLNNGQGGWQTDDTLKAPMTNSVSEIGGGVLLPDGRAFFIGAIGHTALYTPSGSTANGSWIQGPDVPGTGVGWDTPAAVLTNGKVLFTLNTQPVIQYYEFNPNANPLTTANAFQIAPDWNDTNGHSHEMLNLPDGNVLVSYGDATLRVYLPDSSPLPAGKPVISGITAKEDGTYHLSGLKLNGLSQGSSFGDDAQMDTNFPIVRVSDASGNVYFGRTYKWSSTGVQTGNTPVSTEFSIPPDVYASGGPFSLVVIANGISSDPVSFTPIAPDAWLDFYSVAVLEFGTYALPYVTLNHAVNGAPFGSSGVPSGGALYIKGPSSSPETLTISKPMTIKAIGGAVTVGR